VLSQQDALTLALIREAHARIRRYINRTPVLISTTLDAMAGASLFFKCENLQKTGAFKARGAVVDTATFAI
jgi:threonine dehydratase